MAIRLIFALVACVFFLWVNSDIQTGVAMTMNRNARGELVTWEESPIEFAFAILFRGGLAFGFGWVALFYDFGKVKNPKKDRIEKRKSRLKKRHLHEK